MSKVQRITVSNIKAVSEQTIDFNGCTAVITAGNNKGKTTFLRGLFDRIQGVKADIPLRHGTEKGFAECLLDTGEQFRWELDANKKTFEKLTFITKNDIKSSVTRELVARYFPATFDVDTFLHDQPAKQKKTLQKLVGIDFTEVDAAYQKAYDEREGKNRREKEIRILLAETQMPERVDPVSLEALQAEKTTIRAELNRLYLANKTANEAARKAWQETVDKIRGAYDKAVVAERDRIQKHNEKVAEDTIIYNHAMDAVNVLRGFGYKGDAEAWVSTLAIKLGKQESYTAPIEPDYPTEPAYIPEMPDNTALLDVEDRINKSIETNVKAQAWADYETLRERYNIAADEAFAAQGEVEAANAARLALIKSAKMPEGFGFSEDGIIYNDLPFNREQLSSSAIYIAALKLALMQIGEVRTLHFDASYLDKFSLEAIEIWANDNDLQLLIERPSFEGGDITYELVQPA